MITYKDILVNSFAYSYKYYMAHIYFYMLSMAAAKNAKHVTCTDMSKEMLIQSMKKARRLGIYNISFAKRDMTALKDPDNRYDAVIAGNVIHLLDDPQKAFSELIRVTKPGGKIIIPTYLQAEAGAFRLLIKLYGLMGLPFSEEAEPMGADPDVLEYFLFVTQ